MSLKQSVLCMIPSRIGSTRLAQKPLVQLHPHLPHATLIETAYTSALRDPHFREVMVVTDSPKIMNLPLLSSCILTSSQCETGTDRVAEAWQSIKTESKNKDIRVIVNWQGDLPMIDSVWIHALLSPYRSLPPEQWPHMTTVACPWSGDASAVKVVLNQRQQALYFSRSLIPHPHQSSPAKHAECVLQHIGLYAYRVDFLEKFPSLWPAPLSTLESLEQLRVLEHGYTIAVQVVNHHAPPLEINTAEDIERYRKHFSISSE